MHVDDEHDERLRTLNVIPCYTDGAQFVRRRFRARDAECLIGSVQIPRDVLPAVAPKKSAKYTG